MKLPSSIGVAIMHLWVVLLSFFAFPITVVVDSAALLGVNGGNGFSTDLSKLSFNFVRDGDGGLTKLVGKGLSSELEQIDLRLSHSLFSLTPHYIRHTKGDGVWQFEHFDERLEYKRNNMPLLQVLASERLKRYEWKFTGNGIFQDVLLMSGDEQQRDILNALCELDSQLNSLLHVSVRYNFQLCHTHNHNSPQNYALSVSQGLEIIGKLLSQQMELITRHSNKTSSIVQSLQAEVSKAFKQDISKQLEELLRTKEQDQTKNNVVVELENKLNDIIPKLLSLETVSATQSATLEGLQESSHKTTEDIHTHLDFLDDNIYSLSQFVNNSLVTFQNSLESSLSQHVANITSNEEKIGVVNESLAVLSEGLQQMNATVLQKLQAFSQHFLTFAEKQSNHLYLHFLPTLLSNLTHNQSVWNAEWQTKLEEVNATWNTSLTNLESSLQANINHTQNRVNESLATFALQQQVQLEEIQDSTEDAIKQLHKKLHSAEELLYHTVQNNSDLLQSRMDTMQTNQSTQILDLQAELFRQKEAAWANLTAWNSSNERRLEEVSTQQLQGLNVLEAKVHDHTAKLNDSLRSFVAVYEADQQIWQSQTQALNSSQQEAVKQLSDELKKAEDDWSHRWQRQQTHWSESYQALDAALQANVSGLTQALASQEVATKETVTALQTSWTTQFDTQAKQLEEVREKQESIWETKWRTEAMAREDAVQKLHKEVQANFSSLQAETDASFDALETQVTSIHYVQLPNLVHTIEQLNGTHQEQLLSLQNHVNYSFETLATKTNQSLINLQQDLFTLDLQTQDNLRDVQDRLYDHETVTKQQLHSLHYNLSMLHHTQQDHHSLFTHALQQANHNLSTVHKDMEEKLKSSEEEWIAHVKEVQVNLSEDLALLKFDLQDNFLDHIKSLNATLSQQTASQALALDSFITWTKATFLSTNRTWQEEVHSLSSQQIALSQQLEAKYTSLHEKQVTLSNNVAKSLSDWQSQQTESFMTFQNTMTDSLKTHKSDFTQALQDTKHVLQTQLQEELSGLKISHQQKWLEWHSEYTASIKELRDASLTLQSRLEKSFQDAITSIQHNVSFWQFTTDFTLKHQEETINQLQQHVSSVNQEMKNMTYYLHTQFLPDVIHKQQEQIMKIMEQTNSFWDKQLQQFALSYDNKLKDFQTTQTHAWQVMITPLQDTVSKSSTQLEQLQGHSQQLIRNYQQLDSKLAGLQQNHTTWQTTTQTSFDTLHTTTSTRLQQVEATVTKSVTKMEELHEVLSEHAVDFLEVQSVVTKQGQTLTTQQQLLQEVHNTLDQSHIKHEKLTTLVATQQQTLVAQEGQLAQQATELSKLTDKLTRSQEQYFTLQEQFLAYKSQTQQQEELLRKRVSDSETQAQRASDRLATLESQVAVLTTALANAPQNPKSVEEYDHLAQKVRHLEAMVMQHMMALVTAVLPPQLTKS